jgi:hypothetical protein
VDEGKEELIQGILSRARENVITQDPEALPAIPDASEKGSQAARQMLIETLAGAAMGGPMEASGPAAGVPGALVRAVKNRMAKVDGVTPSTEQALGGPREQPEDPQDGLKRLDEKIQTLLATDETKAKEQEQAGEKQAKDIVKRFQKSVKDWEKKYGPKAEAPVLGTQGAVGGGEAQAGAGAPAAHGRNQSGQMQEGMAREHQILQLGKGAGSWWAVANPVGRGGFDFLQGMSRSFCREKGGSQTVAQFEGTLHGGIGVLPPTGGMGPCDYRQCIPSQQGFGVLERRDALGPGDLEGAAVFSGQGHLVQNPAPFPGGASGSAEFLEEGFGAVGP